MDTISKKNKYIKVNGRTIRLAVYSPSYMDHELHTGVLWLHGGGYRLGFPEMFWMSRARDLVHKFGCVVIMPDYTLAWKAPFPAAFEDAWASLLWMKDHTSELGINPDQLMVGGESAGGGLCAAVCLKAARTKEVNIAFAMPLYPMLDDRPTPSNSHSHDPIWNTRKNIHAWKRYLKGSKETSIYAAPARAESYDGFPPCYTFFGDHETFHDEDEEFVRRLKEDGVYVWHDESDHWFHGHDMLLPKSESSRQAIIRFDTAFAYAQKHFFAHNE